MLSPELIIALFSLSVSIFSVLWVLFERIPDMTLGYFEKEENISKIEKINENIREAFDVEMNGFRLNFDKLSDTDIMKEMESLSKNYRHLNTIAIIQNKYINISKKILYNIFNLMIGLLLPIILIIFYDIIKKIIPLPYITEFVIVIYSIPSFTIFRRIILQYKLRHYLRENFLRLYQEPTIDNCKKISDKIIEKEENINKIF